MSIKSRLNRELYGPSLFEVTLGAALSILLGVFLAAGYLIFFTPVKTLRAAPKEGEVARNEVVYIEGSKSTARSGQWMRKRQLLLKGSLPRSPSSRMSSMPGSPTAPSPLGGPMLRRLPFSSPLP
jgi:hypothetical protein